MQTLTFLGLAEKILSEEKRPLTADEIWQTAVGKQYDKLLSTKGKTPWATMAAQLYVQVRDSKDSPFVKIGTRPTRFFLKELVKGTELELLAQMAATVPVVTKVTYKESELHPFLAYYASLFLKAHTKTIQHTKSDKREFGEWVHPDMVGSYFPLEEWKSEVYDLSSATGSFPLKIFSFEIKKELSFGNLREAFFQTVSNSSWAHESYLVAAEISNDEDFRAELRRLSTSFGIGVIRLDVTDPDASEILFPPQTREYLDWETINKLTMNPDFRDFLKRVKTDISSKEVRKEKYDRVLEVEDLVKTIKQPK